MSLAKDRNIPCVVKGGAKRKHGGFSFYLVRLHINEELTALHVRGVPFHSVLD